MAVATGTPAAPPVTESRLRRLRPTSITGLSVWIGVGIFMLILLGVLATVVLSSVSRSWTTGWLPHGYTTGRYGQAWSDFGLAHVLLVTVEVGLAVVALSLLLGIPAAYALARRSFPGKRLVLLVFLLPVLLPPMSYGIQLATALYKVHLAGTMAGVIVANLVPTIPFVVLTMTPFIEQLDRNIESAARMCGASTPQVLMRILAPMVIPGALAAGVLVLVRTAGMFELTFLTAGPDSQTLVVSLYNAAATPGERPTQLIDSMATIYMLTSFLLLALALRFVNPTQLVARIGE
jgi:putative spermidine/putrescine transport system permease protein